MFTRKKILLLLSIMFCNVSHALPLETLILPKGFTIEVYASQVKNARQMALGDKGTIFVGSRGAGLVHALVDNNGDGKVDEVIQIAEKLNMPSGLTFKNSDLYVAEVSRILKYTNIEQTLHLGVKPEVVISDLPKETHHGWKYIDFGPDDWLYVPVGAPCNICETNGGDKFDKPIYASILKYNLETGEKKWVAKGVRNSVGFDWHPQSHQLWFSDNGRDMMGDDIPPCEINRVETEGLHYGYPYFHGGKVRDPEFGSDKKAADYVHPALNLGAHVAPLGIHFYQGKMFPTEYKNKLLVAEHGSWNRSKKSGYRVMMATLENNQVVSYEPFIEGWLQADETTWGRPVALLTMPDGSVLISDDFANVIYRVTYKNSKMF